MLSLLLQSGVRCEMGPCAGQFYPAEYSFPILLILAGLFIWYCMPLFKWPGFWIVVIVMLAAWGMAGMPQ